MYAIIVDNKIVSIQNEFADLAVNLSRVESEAVANEYAAQLKALTNDEYFIYCRNPESKYATFSIYRAPKVGDKVSMAFNGDSYICGEIVKISKTFKRVFTSDGSVFLRVKQSPTWLNGGTFSLIQGHKESRNPHF